MDRNVDLTTRILVLEADVETFARQRETLTAIAEGLRDELREVRGGGGGRGAQERKAMSRASEYAERRPEDFSDGYVYASVTPSGTLALNLGSWAGSLPPERAIALARWMLDTFTDEPQERRTP